MLRLSTALVAAASTIAFSQIASAADMPMKAAAAPVAPTYSWTGFYIGANIGGGWGGPNVDYVANDLVSLGLFSPNLPNLGGGPPPASIHTSGVLGGLQVGYNWQMGPAWLIGAETDIEWSGTKGSASTGGALNIIGAPFANTVEEKVEWLGTVRARLGYLPTPDFLAFVTGGFAYGEVKHSGAYTGAAGVTGTLGPVGFDCTAQPCFSGSASDTTSGWTVGGGLEYAVAGNWTIRAEYLYVSLESKSVIETATALSVGTTIPSSFTANFGQTNLNIVRAALNYRF
jgi:outer membrane immunogenic protein